MSGWIQVRLDTRGQAGYISGWIHLRLDTGQAGYRGSGWIQVRLDTVGQAGFRSGYTHIRTSNLMTLTLGIARNSALSVHCSKKFDGKAGEKLLICNNNICFELNLIA